MKYLILAVALGVVLAQEPPEYPPGILCTPKDKRLLRVQRIAPE